MFMNKIHNIGLKTKLYIIFGIIIAATAAGISIGVTSFSRVQVGGKAYGVIEQNMLVADNIAKLRANLAFIRMAQLAMIIEDSDGRRQNLREDVEALTERVDEIFGVIDGQVAASGQADVKESMEAARSAWNGFRETQDKALLPAIFADNTKDAMALARGVLMARYSAFSADSKEAVDRVRKDVPAMVERMKQESFFVKWMFIVGGVLFVAFYVLVALFFAKTLVTPVALASDRAAQMARGDFSLPPMQARGSDEVGTMIANFSTMQAKISESANRLKANIMNLSSSSEELSATAEDLGKGAAQQASRAREVTAATNQMTQTIGDVAQSAAQAADAAENSSHAASGGKDIVGMTVERLTSITQAVQEAMLTIDGLSKSSGQIGEIVNLIHTIADQTNLLALNAAIEAARAGEQGRGFAVVADEVRKLADRTTNATKDIEHKITTLQEEAEKSLLTIKRGNAEVEKGMGLAKSASEALDEIVKESTNVKDMVQRIAAATEEQSATSEEITKNMNNISGVVEHSSSATAQIRQAAHDLAGLATEIQTMMAWFKTKGA